MSPWKNARVPGIDRKTFLDSVRTAVATLVSLLVARALKFPEYYWAPISTIIIMQSSIQPFQGAWQRFVGTALGAALGGAIASLCRPQRGYLRDRYIPLRDSRRIFSGMERLSRCRHHLQHCGADFARPGLGLCLASFSRSVAGHRGGIDCAAGIATEEKSRDPGLNFRG